MKKLLIMLAALALIYACKSGGDKKATEEKKDTVAQQPPPTTEVPNQKGLEMIAALDCTTCHDIKTKKIGPAYADVAKKYEATPAIIDTLATRVIKGSVGHWGTVQMTP